MPLITRLRDKEADIVAEDGRVPIQKVRGQVHHDGQLGELLEQLARGDRAVVARAASDQQQTATATDLRDVVLLNQPCNPASPAKLSLVHYLDAAQDDGLGLKVDAASHRIHHRFWLFEDLLLHERAVIACKKGSR